MKAVGGIGRGTVILARHGEPALSRKTRLSATGYRDWWARYEVGGLKADQSVPAELARAANTADVIIASTRRRSVETVQALANGRDFTKDARFVEAPLPPPAFPEWVKMSPRHWGFIARVWWWFFNHHQGQESRAQAQQRADAVARDLDTLAAQGQDVLVVAHGFFNTMVGRALKALGWRCVSDEGFAYWSARRFEPRKQRRCP
jgi:broad specificity phosphatase PhoE